MVHGQGWKKIMKFKPTWTTTISLLNLQNEDAILEQEGTITWISLHITNQSISVSMKQGDRIE